MSTFTWKKLGRIFDPELLPDWAVSHAQVPTPIVLGDVVRVFFSTRNKDGKSLPMYADFSVNDPTQLVHFEPDPIFALGEPGTFDDEGVMPAYAHKTEKGDLWLYYSGWNQHVLTPYHNSTGIAVSHDDTHFERLFQGPVMDRTKDEPYLAVTPYILKEESLWRMWYISGIRWTYVKDKYEPVYVIKYASSYNGIDWERSPDMCIRRHSEDEVFSHPTVAKIGNLYHMWFCYRKIHDYRNGGPNGYRMGYAFSEDGLQWQRDDSAAGIDVSESGWDDNMTCYPFVIKIAGVYYMFYNGNSFGQTGFGIASLTTS